eukprot:353188-Chlamydomonas_euryale.AAC.4
MTPTNNPCDRAPRCMHLAPANRPPSAPALTCLARPACRPSRLKVWAPTPPATAARCAYRVVGASLPKQRDGASLPPREKTVR